MEHIWNFWKNLEKHKNSPGHRPTACQIPRTSPCSRFLVLWTTGLQFWSPEGYQNGILRRRPGGQTSKSRTLESYFWAVQKSIPKSITCLSILGAKMLPKSIPKRPKIHPRNHPETIPQKTTQTYRNKPSQTLKIELACRRGAIFHKTAVSEKLQKQSKTHVKTAPKITKNK